MQARLVVPAFLLAAFAVLPTVAAQRAFVSSTGNDANVGVGCTLVAQCRSFQAAHAAVDAGGEIVALDTAGYGAVTISKSVTIMANPGVVAGVAASTGNAITIATEGVDVILRGLAINNAGAAEVGVWMTDGNSLALENVVVSRFAIGVQVQAAAGVRVVNSLMRGNNSGISIGRGASGDIVGSQFLGNTFGFGVHVNGGSTGAYTTVTISDSVSSGNTVGFAAVSVTADATAMISCTRCTASHNQSMGFQVHAGASSAAYMVVSESTATFNGTYGFSNVGAGMQALRTMGNNVADQNVSGTSAGPITAGTLF